MAKRPVAAAPASCCPPRLVARAIVLLSAAIAQVVRWTIPQQSGPVGCRLLAFGVCRLPCWW